jgi:hypothetical protein
VRPGSRFYFNQIFKPTLKNKSKTLEIGFGNGELLNYFSANHHYTVGIEINHELVARAKSSGYLAYAGPPWDIIELQSEKFDLIAAFSVIEHMDFKQLSKLFVWVGSHLSDGGKFYVLFPEGSSPFGLANQNGDFTHLTSLTKPKIEVLCDVGNMELLSYYDEPLSSNKLCSWGLAGKMGLLLLQWYASAIIFVLRILFFPLTTSLKLSVNSIAVMTLRK